MTVRGPLLTRRSLLGASLAGLLTAGCSRTDSAPARELQHRLEAGDATRPREIGVLGDSIAFGGGAFGSTPPKYLDSFVGRLRSAVATTHGDAGTGWVFLNQALWPVAAANAGWDPRLRVVGDVTKPSSGLFRRTCARIPASRGRRPSSYVEFRAEGTTFSTLVLGQASGRSRQLVSVDGGPRSPCATSGAVGGSRTSRPGRGRTPTTSSRTCRSRGPGRTRCGCGPTRARSTSWRCGPRRGPETWWSRQQPSRESRS